MTQDSIEKRELSSIAFNRCGDDAAFYNGVHDLETEVMALRALAAYHAQEDKPECT